MAKSSLDLAAEGLYRQLELLENDITKLPKLVRPIALLYMFQGMVDNGGFRYPMETDLPGNPSYSHFVDAYRHIGAQGAAEALEQAVALFPFDRPECKAEARNKFMDSLGDEDAFETSQFGMLSDRVCGDKTIWTKMDEYVSMHRSDFAPYIIQ